MLTSKKMQEVIGLVLLFGTLLSAVLVLVGGILYLIQNGTQSIHFALTPSSVYRNPVIQIGEIFRSFSPLGIVELGLLTLVVTQILRVALLFFFYATQRDYWFSFISLFIFLTLIYSLLWRA